MENNKSDHDLLVEIKTLLTVVQETLRELKDNNSRQREFNRSIENRVNTIEADRAAVLSEYNQLRETVRTNTKLLEQIKGSAMTVKLLIGAMCALAGALIKALI